MSGLIAAARAAEEEILIDVVDLVGVESHSYDRAALDACRRHVQTLAVRLLGPPDREDILDGGERGDTLLLTWRGTGAGRVLVVGHYDTVWPTGTLAEWPVRADVRDGTEVLTGPGIFDMKTGLVQSLWALTLLRENQDGGRLPTVTFLFNGDEEVGSLSSRPAIEDAAREVDAALVFEPTLGGAVKTGRKGIGLFEFHVTGVEAHAGLDPTAGASAIHALAEAITAATTIADLAAGTSVNVGLISGGTGTNVAAGRAWARIDIRVSDEAEKARVDAAFDAITPSDPRVTLRVDHRWNRPVMALDDTMRPLLDVVVAAGADLGLDLDHVSVGGGSDANFIAGIGVPVICGLGAVGAGPHSRDEYIVPGHIPVYTALGARVLQRLADGLPR
ncbi:glutamate carboxypeptidase [Tersicoccus solisilvae]|uniref:Glutamate carboxypeptidase n=1 Tax=Tersicoccus solisilvae TaxID=1882339 RepID=A0ABQ1NPB6_9MICC|nr:M20 family metallopeptidase [Tersicoccus solisilvae]GGC82108.1 glutamate carboxypeptidase [Tersicoccus solisilvae]